MKVLGELFVPCFFVVVIIVDRQVVVPTSFDTPTIVLFALVVWKKELVVVGVAIDKPWACQADVECVACSG